MVTELQTIERAGASGHKKIGLELVLKGAIEPMMVKDNIVPTVSLLVQINFNSINILISNRFRNAGQL